MPSILELVLARLSPQWYIEAYQPNVELSRRHCWAADTSLHLYQHWLQNVWLKVSVQRQRWSPAAMRTADQIMVTIVCQNVYANCKPATSRHCTNANWYPSPGKIRTSILESRLAHMEAPYWQGSGLFVIGGMLEPTQLKVNTNY